MLSKLYIRDEKKKRLHICQKKKKKEKKGRKEERKKKNNSLRKKKVSETGCVYTIELNNERKKMTILLHQA